MSVFASLALAALTSSEAVLTLLNSSNSVSLAKFEEAQQQVALDAIEGKPLQQFVVGIMSDDKEFAKRNLDASRDKILALAQKKNNALAWYLLSVEKNDIVMLRRAADGGNVQALNALGTIAIQEAMKSRDNTNLTERAFKLGFDSFRRAAREKDPNALVNLGTCYMRGIGCQQNCEVAFEAFATAAKLGHPEAMDFLSACYELGHGVKKDAALSLSWRMRARALRGDMIAQEWLKERR